MFTWDTVYDVDCSEVNKSAADAIMTSARIYMDQPASGQNRSITDPLKQR